jgi:hypothetical protein
VGGGTGEGLVRGGDQAVAGGATGDAAGGAVEEKHVGERCVEVSRGRYLSSTPTIILSDSFKKKGPSEP